MSDRTTKTTVTFKMPFMLFELGELLPAGDYVVETQEELLQGVSFPAYQRVQTQIHLNPKPGVMQKLTVDPIKLAATVRQDEASVDTTADHNAGHSTKA